MKLKLHLPIIRERECLSGTAIHSQVTSPPQFHSGNEGNPAFECATCLGVDYSDTITATGIGPELTWTIDSGTLPPGLTFHGGFSTSGSVVIDGTPTTAGNYSFVIRATDLAGNWFTDTFTINIVDITTTALPGYTVGTPYSFTLTATGGSGSYAWRLSSGAFPDGIVMDSTGLISGTPTGVNSGTMPLEFEVIDLGCVEATPEFFTPRIEVVGSSVTTIATVLGYHEYIASTPPKGYHKLTWTGYALQTAHTVGGFDEKNGDGFFQQNCCGVRYDWAGFGEIDTHGNQISNYTKILSAQCVKNYAPLLANGLGEQPLVFTQQGIMLGLRGYCWQGATSANAVVVLPADPNTCDSCPTTLSVVGNVATNSTGDVDDLLIDPASGTQTKTSTQLTNISSADLVFALDDQHEAFPDFTTGGVTNFPWATLNGIVAHWISCHSEHNFTATLSDEYTDAEALSNAAIVHSSGLTAQSAPRTTGFISSWTTVSYKLNFSNLVAGVAYVASVTFVDSDSSQTVRNYSFTAAGATHTITDTIPTPADGHKIKLTLPTVALA